VRRTLVLVALALAGGSVVTSSLAAATGQSAKASVEVVSVDPLRVAGTGFGAHERVRMTVWIDGTRTNARVRAGRRGSFSLRIATPVTESCRSSVTVVARGARGSRAMFALTGIACVPTS
jgi:hypothetical protein